MKQFLCFLGLLLLVTPSAYSTDTKVIWLKLSVIRTYEDFQSKCFGSSAEGQIFFSAEIQDGKVVVAQLQNYPNVSPYKPIYRALELTRQEIGRLRLFEDSRGEWWLKGLYLSESSLRWLLYEAGKTYSFCPAPQPLETVTPEGFEFEFETEGIEAGIWLSDSNKTLVEGVRKDGKKYRGAVSFVQKEFRCDL